MYEWVVRANLPDSVVPGVARATLQGILDILTDGAAEVTNEAVWPSPAEEAAFDEDGTETGEGAVIYQFPSE